MLVDEITDKYMFSKLGDQTFPETVRMILVLNPIASGSDKSLLTLPPSFLHATLTTPYRSTIAITRLARVIAECKGLVVPEGDFGSDVEGTKPILFDIGKDKRKMEEALEECHKQLGDNVTVLYDGFNRERIEKWVKAAGAHWDCYSALNFYGWEDQRVVIVSGGDLMEQITRAKTKLYILLEDDGYGDDYYYSKTKGYFQQTAEKGLVETVKLNDADEGNEGLEEDEGNEELDEVKEVNKGDGCLPGCCTS